MRLHLTAAPSLRSVAGSGTDGAGTLGLVFPAAVAQQRVSGKRLMRAKLPLIAGFVLAPICAFGLFWQWGSIWVLCPQALIVMFVRQWQHAYDSLGAVGYPDLVVGVLYYPFVGWLLTRALRAGKLARVGGSVALWHVAAIGVAWAAAETRNKLWGFG